MDNFSHTLAGMVAAETASERTQAAPTKRVLLFAASILANNFPDLDLVYSDVIPPPLGYLLHHRGHTHTLGGAVLEVLLIFALLLLVPPFRKELKDPGTARLTAGVIAIGLLLHLMMDGWNSYGVHPLWPLSGRWFYGDAVFILEPFVWLGFGVPLLHLVKTKIGRGLIALILVGAPVAAFFGGFLSAPSLGALALFGATLVGASRATSRIGRLGLAVGSVLLFVLVQLGAGVKLRSNVAEEFKPETDTHRILAVISNPAPANPFCWHEIRIEADPARDLWRVVAAKASLLSPEWARTVCPTQSAAIFSADGRLSELRAALANDCRVEAWLRFVRAPVFEHGSAIDARFSSGLRGNFSELPAVGTPHECPWFLPGWDHPRQDLMDMAQGA